MSRRHPPSGRLLHDASCTHPASTQLAPRMHRTVVLSPTLLQASAPFEKLIRVHFSSARRQVSPQLPINTLYDYCNQYKPSSSCIPSHLLHTPISAALRRILGRCRTLLELKDASAHHLEVDTFCLCTSVTTRLLKTRSPVHAHIFAWARARVYAEGG